LESEAGGFFRNAGLKGELVRLPAIIPLAKGFIGPYKWLFMRYKLAFFEIINIPLARNFIWVTPWQHIENMQV